MDTPFRFRKSWRVTALKWVLSIQVLLGCYSIYTGLYNAWTLLIFVLLAFFWLSILIKSPSFVKLSGYYMYILGFFSFISISQAVKFTSIGNIGGTITMFLDFIFFAFITYLLWSKEKLVLTQEEIRGSSLDPN